MGRVIILDVPVGFHTGRLLRPIAERIRDAGLDIEEYYCPMFPEERLEHIVCQSADIAIVTSNDFHTVCADDFDSKVSVCLLYTSMLWLPIKIYTRISQYLTW